MTTAFILLSLNSLKVNAELLQFENIRLAGLGCPSQSTQIAFAPDRTLASIIFSQFESHVPYESSKGTVYAFDLACNMFIDIIVPQDEALTSLEISYDMRGFAALDSGVLGKFSSHLMSITTANSANNRQEKLVEQNFGSYTQDEQTDINISQTLNVSTLQNCRLPRRAPERVTIHLQNHLATQILNRTSGAQGSLVMDSSDFSGGIKFRPITERCRSEGRIERPTRPERPRREVGRVTCHLENRRGRVERVCDYP